jgi:hypothetical protein
MAYIPRWERLPNALRRVMVAVRLSQDEAQVDICRALADGAIRIRGKLQRHTTRPLRASNTVLDGKYFQIPTEVKSEDLDWDTSRPVKPWMVQRGSFKPSGYWELEWIELCRIDVTNVLCIAGNRGESSQHAPTRAGATRRRTRPTLERAQSAIRELYPHGVPEQRIEPNSRLCRRVGDRLRQEELPGVSDDTILRAAGRRT